jgi:acyl-CoA thioesterase I
MMRNFQTLILIVVAALILSACSKSPTIAPLSNSATILAFGDSLTFGTGATPETSYPAVLKNLIGMNVIAQGVPGEVSADGLRRLTEVLDEVKPALLILCHGGNDFLQKKPEAEAAANMRAMVSLAKNKGINVVLIATPKPGFSVTPPDFYAEIAKEFSIPIESKVLREILTDNSLKSDLVHPNAAGYKLIAERVAELLRKSGAIS